MTVRNQSINFTTNYNPNLIIALIKFSQTGKLQKDGTSRKTVDKIRTRYVVFSSGYAAFFGIHRIGESCVFPFGYNALLVHFYYVEGRAVEDSNSAMISVRKVIERKGSAPAEPCGWWIIADLHSVYYVNHAQIRVKLWRIKLIK